MRPLYGAAYFLLILLPVEEVHTGDGVSKGINLTHTCRHVDAVCAHNGGNGETMENTLTALGFGLEIISKLFGIAFVGFWIFILIKLMLKILAFFGRIFGYEKTSKLKTTGKKFKNYRSYAMSYAIEHLKKLKEDYYEDEIKFKPRDYREMAVAYLDGFVWDESPDDQMARILEAKVNNTL